MEKFIGLTLKEKLFSLSCITLMPAMAVFIFIRESNHFAFPLFMLCGIPLYFFERGPFLNRYKIQDNSLIVKKLTGTKTYSFDELEKVQIGKDLLTFKFSSATFKIVLDKNTLKLLEYFLKNNALNVLEKKFNELDESTRVLNVDPKEVRENGLRKDKRLPLFLSFVVLLAVTIDLFIERIDDFRYYLFVLGSFGFFTLAAFAKFIGLLIKGNENTLVSEYIDKNGFHLCNEDIAFSEIAEARTEIKRWGVRMLVLVTKDGKKHEMLTVSFEGDVLYEMYLYRKIYGPDPKAAGSEQ